MNERNSGAKLVFVSFSSVEFNRIKLTPPVEKRRHCSIKRRTGGFRFGLKLKLTENTNLNCANFQLLRSHQIQ